MTFKIVASQGERIVFDQRVEAASPREAREVMKRGLRLESLTGLVYAIRNRLTALEGRKGNAGEAITDEEGSKLPQRFDPTAKLGASPPSKAERREPTRAIPARLRAILGPDWKAIRRHYAKTKSIKQTAANFDVPINTLKARIRREGWSK